jgi:hypothetical protein
MVQVRLTLHTTALFSGAIFLAQDGILSTFAACLADFQAQTGSFASKSIEFAQKYILAISISSFAFLTI